MPGLGTQRATPLPQPGGEHGAGQAAGAAAASTDTTVTPQCSLTNSKLYFDSLMAVPS